MKTGRERATERSAVFMTLQLLGPGVALALVVWIPSRQPRNGDNFGLALCYLSLGALLGLNLAYELRTEYTGEGIFRPYRKPIAWREVTELRLGNNCLILVRKRGSLRIRLRQFRDPDAFVAFVQKCCAASRERMIESAPGSEQQSDKDDCVG